MHFKFNQTDFTFASLPSIVWVFGTAAHVCLCKIYAIIFHSSNSNHYKDNIQPPSPPVTTENGGGENSTV